VRVLLEADAWPEQVALWVCPCLNPAGFGLNRRENAQSIDLNRDYRHGRTAEVRAHQAWLESQPPFDLAICLHEDWEAGGFYLYELNPDARPSLAQRVIEAVRPVCPIDPAEKIDGREARFGIIRPELDPAVRLEWPEAFYLIQSKTRLSYTFEAPSDYALDTRVAALATAVGSAVSTAARAAFGCARCDGASARDAAQGRVGDSSAD
jgi:hypothetical protein